MSEFLVLSILKSVDELETVMVRALPFPSEDRMHPDSDWVIEEYTKWAKKFPDYSRVLSDIEAFLVVGAHSWGSTKERVLSVLKVLENTFQIDYYLPTIRKERSPEKAQIFIDKTIRALRTGEADQDFIMGKRLIESLEDFKRDATEEELKTMITSLEMGFKAHLDIVCNYWMKNQFIPLKEYVKKRSQESCWPFYLHICGYSLDYQMPDSVRNNQLVKEFTEKAYELGLSIDDYLMAKVKIMRDDITSRVICYLNEKRCSLQEAIDHHYDYAMGLYEEVLQLRDQIRSDPELMSDKLNAWMSTVMETVYVLFRVCKKVWKYEVRADQTIHSQYWDKLFKELKVKIN